jgi:phage/plasmid-like protein (TIGR03299 family)
MATVAQFTSVRVVCNNTLRLAVQSADGTSRPRLSVPHNTVFDANKVKLELGLAGNSWDVFIDDARRMSDRKMTRQEELAWLIETFGNPKVGVEDQSNADAKIMKQVHSLYAGNGKGSTLPGAERTLWGMINATTEYMDFHTGHKTIDSRFDKAQFGESAATKSRAWDNALMMLA